MKNYQILIILLFSTLLAACMPEEETIIQGSWYWENQHIAEVIGESYQVVTWHFDRGTFTYESCCYPIPMSYSGNYRVTSIKDDMLILEVFNLQGSSHFASEEIFIFINKEADTIDIMGASPFTRILP